MRFHVTHRMGDDEEIPASAFPALLRELDDHPEDTEHGSVDVTHESGWSLGAYRGGYVVYENLDEGEPRHMQDVPPEKIIALWCMLAEGKIDALEEEPWQQGY